MATASSSNLPGLAGAGSQALVADVASHLIPIFIKGKGPQRVISIADLDTLISTGGATTFGAGTAAAPSVALGSATVGLFSGGSVATTDEYLGFSVGGSDKGRITYNGRLVLGATAIPTLPSSRKTKVYLGTITDWGIIGTNGEGNQNKSFRIGTLAYTATQDAVTGIVLTGQSAANLIAIGGGLSYGQAMTAGQLYAAAAVNTASGTPMLYWSTAGVRIQSGATTAASYLLHVAGTSDTLLFTVHGAADRVAVGGASVASAKFSITSTTMGFLPPRMDETARDAISTPATGLVIYNTTTNVLNFYNGSAWGAV